MSQVKNSISKNQKFLNEVQNLQFWKNLCPELNVTQLSGIWEKPYHSLHREQWELCEATLKLDGYFVYQDFLNEALINRCKRCIDTLVEHDIPPVFSFVYDEFWQILSQLDPFLKNMFEEGYQILPDFFAWFVTHENNSGFTPHRDHVTENFINEDGSPNYSTFWIPLVDVTPTQSCIYVMPGSHDEHYPDNLFDINIDKAEKIRALPARAGSVLSWNVGVMHWGSVPSPLAPPRQSIAFCAQSSKSPLLGGNIPLDFSKAFPLQKRLGLIGKQLIEYSRARQSDAVSFMQHLANLDEAPKEEKDQ